MIFWFRLVAKLSGTSGVIRINFLAHLWTNTGFPFPSEHEYFSGNMSPSSMNWTRQSLMRSGKLLDAGNRANTRDTVSWEIRFLQPLNRSIPFLPCGPSPTRQRSRLKSWSTQAPLWWLSLEEPSASSLASHLSRFGTNLVPCEDLFEIS